MKLPNWLVKIAEIIFKGRQAGLWSEKHGGGKASLGGGKPPLGSQPSKPEDIKGVRP